MRCLDYLSELDSPHHDMSWYVTKFHHVKLKDFYDIWWHLLGSPKKWNWSFQELKRSSFVIKLTFPDILWRLKHILKDHQIKIKPISDHQMSWKIFQFKMVAFHGVWWSLVTFCDMWWFSLAKPCYVSWYLMTNHEMAPSDSEIKRSQLAFRNVQSLSGPGAIVCLPV